MTWIRYASSLVLLGVIGCGGDPDNSITLVPVKGTITLNGKPMANAAVSFVPDAGNKFNTPGGDTTGPEGNYMARFRNRSGLAPGKYKVMITPGTSTAAGNVSEAFKDDPFMASEAARAKPVAKAMEIKGEFEGEVTETGATLDYDVKATSAATAAKK